MRQLSAAFALLVLALAFPASGAYIDFGGCETGTAWTEADRGTNATTTVTGTIACATGTKRSGAYGLHVGSTTAAAWVTELLPVSATVFYFRIWFNGTTLSGNSCPGEPIFSFGAGAQTYEIRSCSAFTLVDFYFVRTTTQIGNGCGVGAALSSGWHVIEGMVDTTSAGSNDLYWWSEDGKLCGSGNTGINTANVTQVWLGRGTNRGSLTTDYWLDDWAFATTPIPVTGRTIGRQGEEGAPTYTGGACTTCSSQPGGGTCQGTITSGSGCCNMSQTPIGSANECHTTANTQVRTILIAPFNAAETNPTAHGPEYLLPADPLNACKLSMTGIVGSGGSSTALKFRKRFSGSDVTDTGNFTITTTNTVYTDVPWLPPTNNGDLDAMEAGWLQFTGTKTLTVWDEWVQCEVEKSTAAPTGTRVHSD